jgi:hypothetical protein
MRQRGVKLLVPSLLHKLQVLSLPEYLQSVPACCPLTSEITCLLCSSSFLSAAPALLVFNLRHVDKSCSLFLHLQNPSSPSMNFLRRFTPLRSFSRTFTTTRAIMSKLYVGNLSWNTTDDTLRTTFSEFGEVTDSVRPSTIRSLKLSNAKTHPTDHHARP